MSKRSNILSSLTCHLIFLGLSLFQGVLPAAETQSPSQCATQFLTAERDRHEALKAEFSKLSLEHAWPNGLLYSRSLHWAIFTALKPFIKPFFLFVPFKNVHNYIDYFDDETEAHTKSFFTLDLRSGLGIRVYDTRGYEFWPNKEQETRLKKIIIKKIYRHVLGTLNVTFPSTLLRKPADVQDAVLLKQEFLEVAKKTGLSVEEIQLTADLLTKLDFPKRLKPFFEFYMVWAYHRHRIDRNPKLTKYLKPWVYRRERRGRQNFERQFSFMPELDLVRPLSFQALSETTNRNTIGALDKVGPIQMPPLSSGSSTEDIHIWLQTTARNVTELAQVYKNFVLNLRTSKAWIDAERATNQYKKLTIDEIHTLVSTLDALNNLLQEFSPKFIIIQTSSASLSNVLSLPSTHDKTVIDSWHILNFHSQTLIGNIQNFSAFFEELIQTNELLMLQLANPQITLDKTYTDQIRALLASLHDTLTAKIR